MDVRLSITGLEEIDAVLRGFPAEFSHKVLQAAHAEAAKPMVNRMHLLAPVGKTGRTADSIGVIKGPFSSATVIGEVIVGPRRGRFGGSKAHFTEFGTRERLRGATPRRPWVEPGFEQTDEQVVSLINVSLGIKALQFMKRKIKNG